MFIIASVVQCSLWQLQHDVQMKERRKITPKTAGRGEALEEGAIDEYELELSGRAPVLRETLTSK